MNVPRSSRCNNLRFMSWENVEVHNQTQHAPIVVKYLCPKWPRCQDSRHSNGLYSTLSNLRVHLFKHHHLPKGRELNRLKVKKVLWRRNRFNPNEDDSDNYDSDDDIPLSAMYLVSIKYISKRGPH